jgi:hypothetical protein
MGNPRPSHPSRLICPEEEGGKACIHDAFVHMPYVYVWISVHLDCTNEPIPSNAIPLLPTSLLPLLADLPEY